MLNEIHLLFIREDMEKVNIMFHENNTVTYQHKKILEFVPELSVDKNLQIITPNIPLLVSITFFLLYLDLDCFTFEKTKLIFIIIVILFCRHYQAK